MATITGTSGADNVSDTTDADYISLLGGDDALVTGGGADTIYLGAGNDTIAAGGGTDKVWGNAGADVFTFIQWNTTGDDVLIVRDFDPTYSYGLGDQDRLGVPLGTDIYDIQGVTVYGTESTQVRCWTGDEETGEWLAQTFILVNFAPEKFFENVGDIFVFI